MKYINEEKINNLLADAKSNKLKFDSILKKAKSLKGLSLEEVAFLLQIEEPKLLDEIFKAASFVKDKIYGRRVVLFAPLYISNFCKNYCIYCAFRADNKKIRRRALTKQEIKKETEVLLKQGHKRILMVCGESGAFDLKEIDYYLEAIEAIYSARFGQNRIRRVNVNCAPLSVKDFKKLKKARIGTYQLFQETYHEATYIRVHPRGPKSDPDNRITAIDRAFLAGIDDVGIGVLFGLYDYKFEVLALLSHIKHLEEKFKVGPHTISVPRIEPAVGSEFSLNPPYKVSDKDFKKIVAILRLAVPYTGIILSTRETPEMRNLLVSLGVSQISAGSKTSPGGYTKEDENSAQFFLGDNRSLEEIVVTLMKKDYIPSFCTACYRKGRTGEVFMSLAKPGVIKDSCTINALLTLKEYLRDFGSESTKKIGKLMIDRYLAKLSREQRNIVKTLLEQIEFGKYDQHI